VPIRIASRVFQPRPFTTLLAIGLIVGLVCLGRWQLHRAEEKRGLYEEFAAGGGATRVLNADSAPLPRYQHVEAAGAYDSSRQLLIDNMSDAHDRVGYYVITPFALKGGGWVLVNRGWVPMGASRAATPRIDVPAGERVIHGRADHLPRAGLTMGHPAALAPPFPVVANFPTVAEIARLLGERSWSTGAELVLLDAGEPDGYQREWQAPGFPPIRHVAYAVQWFALALTLAVIYVVTNFRAAGTGAHE
jgi:surfeit locus 1 family protein